MKSILFTLLTIISFTTFSQKGLTRNDYVWPLPNQPGYENGLPADFNKVYISNTSVHKMKDPVLNLQLGVKDQLRANNYKWTAIGLNVAAYGFWIAHISSPGGSLDTGGPFNILGTIAGVAGVGCWFSSAVHERRAVKRMYWGMNGITIPLNQQ